MQERTYEEPLGQRTVLPPIIKAKFPSAQNCVVPLCQSCLLARARKRTPNVKQTRVCVCVYFWPPVPKWGPVKHEIPISSPPLNDISSIP